MNTNESQFLPSQIFITNTTGVPEAHTNKVVGARPGQKRIPMNEKTVKVPYNQPVTGAANAKQRADEKKLNNMFGNGDL